MVSTVKWYVFGAIISTVISLAGLVLIAWKTTPADAPASSKILFSTAFFILMWSIAMLTDFLIKIRPLKSRLLEDRVYESVFYASFVRGLFFSLAIMTVILIRKHF